MYISITNNSFSIAFRDELCNLLLCNILLHFKSILMLYYAYTNYIYIAPICGATEALDDTTQTVTAAAYLLVCRNNSHNRQQYCYYKKVVKLRLFLKK